jgi:hypothetical protein
MEDPTQPPVPPSPGPPPTEPTEPEPEGEKYDGGEIPVGNGEDVPAETPEGE